MGMCDHVRLKWKLPWPEVQDAVWQSKDTSAQYLDLYEIREDGTLWHLAYDMRVEDEPGTLLGVGMYRDNEQWEQIAAEGEIEVHHGVDLPDESGYAWYRVIFWFRDGLVKDVIYKSGVTAKAEDDHAHCPR